MKEDKEDLRRALLEAIDGALRFFGESVRSVVYYYCEAKYGVRKEELVDPDKVDSLVNCIREVFGEASRVLEDKILSSIVLRFNLDRRKLPRNFEKALKQIVNALLG
ncbi:MAG: hypothetical protein DRJ97_02425 [Thermoprotei archaeon]|nr:MAG: hypothetical protein DRJ97_02425 [Thermoprotei archaeon]